MTEPFAFDTLGYSKHRQDVGVSPPAGGAHAEAARDFIMAELVTKTDLQADLRAAVVNLKSEIEIAKSSLTIRLGSMIGGGVVGLVILQCFH